ncbi:ladderlectin isoform X3 [Scophthalmus maximus]|uniref:ladderlectin isoform X2 n=1 Tax=Scophthalmus maximus TaxID=52904 RepID=UPI0015E0E967|nr:ladderlectin isoform X2 [Scophthalmus maximus]XP_035505037.1 ladderlectin isoform X3 [Scophthalmus maximus]
MKAVLLLTVLLSGVLAITAAAVEAVEPAQAPLELQEENQVAEIEVGVAAPEVEAPEKSGEMALSVKGRFFACPTGWVRYKNSCYLYVSTGKSWSSAAAHCDSLGATLASVKNVFDYSFLQDLTRRAGSTVAWMGGFYFQGWRWVDQSLFNYNYWNSQNSVSSYPCIYLNARAGWSNHNCGNRWPSICMTKSDTC